MGKRLYISASCLLSLWIGWIFLKPTQGLPLWDLTQVYLAAELIRAGDVAQLHYPPAYAPYIADLVKDYPTTAKMSRYWNRPAWEAPLLLPLAWMSFQAACRVAFLGNLLLVGLLVWKLPQWHPRQGTMRPWLLSFMPFLWSVALGQDTLILTLLVGYGLSLSFRGKDRAAGIVLGAGLFKPHLLFLLPVVFLIARRWRLAGYFAGTAIVLALVSLALVGVDGMREWRALLQAPTTDIRPWSMGNIRAIQIHFGAGTAVMAAIAALLASGWTVMRGTFREQCAVALAMALLLSPHTYLQDYSLMAVAVLIAFPALVRYAFLTPWPYFIRTDDALPFAWLLFGAVLALALWPTIAREFRERHPTRAVSPSPV